MGGTVNNSLCVGIYLAIGLGSGLATHVQGLVIGVLYSNNVSGAGSRRRDCCSTADYYSFTSLGVEEDTQEASQGHLRFTDRFL